MTTHNYSDFFHYGTIALSVALTSLGVGIGEGIASQGALEAMNIQPNAKSDIARTAIIAMALIDTAAIIGITVALMLLFDVKHQAPNIYASVAELGIAFAIGISGLVLGLVSALPAQQTMFAIARQPFFSQQIFRFMLITLSIIQTPIIFGFIIAIFIKDQAAGVTTAAECIRLIASGVCIGLGSIGPSIGLGHFAKTACQSIGINRNAYGQLFSFTLISEAIIETPIIFTLIVSLLLITTTIPDDNMLTAMAMLGSAICMGMGTLGAGIGSGKTAAAACQQIAINPEQYSLISRTSMLAQGLIDTSAIYALLIALLLFFFK